MKKNLDKKTPEIIPQHKADLLRLLSSDPDLVQVAYSAGAPVKL